MSLHQGFRSFGTHILLLILLLACAKDNGDVGVGSQNLGQANIPNPFSDQFSGEFGGALGDGSSGSLTQPEVTGLKNLFGELEGVNPQEETSDLPPELLAAFEEILRREAGGEDLFPQKLALAGQMLTHCTLEIGKYAPRPGEPLIGRWEGGKGKKGGPGDGDDRRGTGKKKKKSKSNFSMQIGANFPGTFQKKRGVSRIDTRNEGFRGAGLPTGAPSFLVIGKEKGKKGFKGVMMASPNGVGQIRAGDWQGVVTDIPQSGIGKMFKGGKGGKKYDVHLVSSGNMIPHKYHEAMKRAGQCFRQALFLMSPVMNKMFLGMDPQLAQLIKFRMLGLSQ